MWNDGAEFSSGPDCVRPKLYLGDAVTAEDKNALKRCSISHILSLCGGPAAHPEDFSYLVLDNVIDCHTQDLLPHFTECLSFIRDGVTHGSGVLVHCAAGVSRSVTVVVAYLMMSESLSPHDALAEVRKARPCACPNPGFMKQLCAFHTQGCTLDRDPKLCRRLELARLAADMRCGTGDVGLVPWAPDPVAVPPSAESNSKGVFPYRCKRCSRKLFDERHTVSHRMSANGGRCEVYVEPCEWMRPQLAAHGAEHDGRLTCPNTRCGVLIGRWSWAAEACCGCGVCVEPAFVIDKKKVQQ